MWARRSAVARSASATLRPWLSHTAPISSSVRAPANTDEPIMPGAKREPSSFIHATTSSGRRRGTPASSSACAASSAATTP